MSDKIDKRKDEMCYNCKHFIVRETKNRTMFICKDDRFRLVGAGWCKSYEPVKDREI